MSWGTCYAGSNNIHYNFPSMMSDGRNYTVLEPQVVIDKQIQNEENIKSNFEYRKYLQSNALNIMKHNQLNSCGDCGICPYNISNFDILKQPFFYSNIVSNNSPFGYENSDLKNEYLSRQMLQSRLFTSFTKNTN